MNRIEFLGLEKKKCSQCGNMHNVSSMYFNKEKGNLWCISCLALEKRNRDHQQWEEKKKKRDHGKKKEKCKISLKEIKIIPKIELKEIKIIPKIECNHCKENTQRRIVITSKPLEKIDVEFPDGYVEYLCNNIIKTKKRGIDAIWIEEKCRNRILVKKNENNIGEK